MALAVLAASPTMAQQTAPSPLPAFPGAEGFGGMATGGRGHEIIHVTNLNNDGAGSLRDAVSKPNRFVVFDVAGIIRISSPISVKSNITIAGQTAFTGGGEGITVYGDQVSFSNESNIITRHMRFRMSHTGTSGKDSVSVANGQNMVFDHVSIAFGKDENFSVTGTSKDVTIQDSIIGLGLQPHSCGGLIEADGVSILRTLYINNHTRNAKVKQKNQYVNNVVYNWGVAAYIAGDSAGRSDAMVLGNYFIKGPRTSANPITRANANFNLFAGGNFYDDTLDGALNGKPLDRTAFGPVTWRETPYDYPKLANTMTAEEAYRHIVREAGASLTRDAVDRKLVSEDLASLGKIGHNIQQDVEFGGIGELKPMTPLADADKDGMPDDWEKANNLNPADATDAKKLDKSGYSMIEIYVNELANRK